MRINEIFYSIQGEGVLAGMPSVFVRTSGCNLRCVWCDTPDTSWSPRGRNISVQQIVQRVGAYPARHVVLTGGEPLLQPEAADLAAALRAASLHLTVETAGTIFVPLAMDLLSLSPKLSHSTPHHRAAGRHAAAHERLRLNIPAMRQLLQQAPARQIKFVVQSPADMPEIFQLLQQLGHTQPSEVLLMAEGIDPDPAQLQWMAEQCMKTGFRLSPRLHTQIWGDQRGK